MAGLKQDIRRGIATRIAKLSTQKLSFTQPTVPLLIPAPPQAGGLLTGVVGGLAGSAGELLNRYDAVGT